MLNWLPNVLRLAGLQVVEHPGWETRSRAGGISPQGLVVHHTVTPFSMADKEVERLLADGYRQLPGPLVQLGLRRNGTFVVIAAGRCNHNGYGEWGNDSIGVEAYNNGIDEPWPVAQMEAWVKGCAAICRYMGWDETKVKAHRETDPKRKIDPHSINMDDFRFWVALNILRGVPVVELELPVIAIGLKVGLLFRCSFCCGGKHHNRSKLTVFSVC